MHIDELLKFISKYVAGMMLVTEKGEPKSDFIRGWNDGVATAANELLDENTNGELISAINRYKAGMPLV